MSDNNALHTSEIRPADKKDLDALTQMEADIFSHPWDAGMIEGSMNGAYDRVYVATNDGEIAGYIIYSVVCDCADLLRVAVSLDFRRQGMAEKMMHQMEKDCKDEGASSIFLEVRESNESAIMLYNKMNFQKISVRKNYYSSPVEDGIVMQKNI